MTPASGSSEIRSGFMFAVAAFLIWGLSPIFWKYLSAVPSRELLAHRVLWCAVLIVPILILGRQVTDLRNLLSRPRTLATLLLTTALIGSNWFFYIWAVATDRILHASLGYFINPLVNILLGMLFLGETLRPKQKVSVAIAALGVSLMTWQLGHVPWISLVLAVTFGFYGLLRKTVDATPEQGLALETWLLSPIAVLYLAQLHGQGGAGGAWGHQGWTIDLLLVLTGVITAAPLLCFTHGARRLSLSMVGILQYIAPTCQFLLAVVVYDEPFGTVHLIAFVFIWIALGLFTTDAFRASRGRP